MDAKADLSLHCSYKSKCRFCSALALIEALYYILLCAVYNSCWEKIIKFPTNLKSI